MRKLTVFNLVSLDGYFVDSNGDMSWAHKNDEEWTSFMASNASGGGELIFGRVTYDLMIQYWPTPMAAKNSPTVAEHMNNLPKIVFSSTLEKASWKNTRVIKGDLAAEVRKLKNQPGPNLVILGSGTIVTQLAREGLIDAYQVVVSPIVLGKGRTMFEGVPKQLHLKVTESRTFRNGNIFVSYEPAA
jgi:dihydrofolate reductase